MPACVTAELLRSCVREGVGVGGRGYGMGEGRLAGEWASRIKQNSKISLPLCVLLSLGVCLPSFLLDLILNDFHLCLALIL